MFRMTFCSALFIMFFGYFLAEKRLLALDAVLAVVSFTLLNPQVLEAIGIEPGWLGPEVSNESD